jgi:hypothetical protein
VASWARAIRKPSDIGCDDEGFTLPPLEYVNHILDIPFIPAGELFHRPAITLNEQRDERKRTIPERCDKVAELVAHNRPAIAWCHYNEEGDRLAKIIPDSIEVAGRHSDDFKEGALNDFATGNIRVLVSKPKIACWGMNYQHCADMTFFPTYSFEQFYQGVRRCWRFGQGRQVNVHVVAAEGESDVMSGLEMKQKQAARMFESLVRFMGDAMALASEDKHAMQSVVPSWMVSQDVSLGV